MIRAETLNHYLRRRRVGLGFTQTKVAQLVDVAISTINHIEAGDYTRFPLHKVHALAKVLGEDRDKFSALWIEAILGSHKQKLYRKIYGLGDE